MKEQTGWTFMAVLLIGNLVEIRGGYPRKVYLMVEI